MVKFYVPTWTLFAGPVTYKETNAITPLGITPMRILIVFLLYDEKVYAWDKREDGRST